MNITKEILDKARTDKGEFTWAQIDMAIKLVGSPWIKAIQRIDITDEWLTEFFLAKLNKQRPKFIGGEEHIKEKMKRRKQTITKEEKQ